MKRFHHWYDRQHAGVQIVLLLLIATPFSIGSSPDAWNLSVSPVLAACLILFTASMLMTRIWHVMPLRMR